MTTRITDRDRGAKALLRRLRGTVTIRVGVIGTAARAAHPKAGMSVGELASLHELGIGVPRRSFLRDTFDQEWSTTKASLRLIPRSVVSGSTAQAAATRFGESSSKSVVASIDANISPPLDPSTIAGKSNAGVLVDTGTLRRAVSCEVEVNR
jgi:hypothetical protein